MSKIESAPFVAYPVELVPSVGVNEIMENQKQTSNELWTLLAGIMEGAPEFASILFSDKFNVPLSSHGSIASLQNDENNNISKVLLGNNRSVTFEYDTTGLITGLEGSIYAINLTMLVDSMSITKRFEFVYVDGDIVDIKLIDWQGV